MHVPLNVKSSIVFESPIL